MDFTQHIMISAVVIFTILVGVIVYLITRIVKLQRDKDETINNLVNMYSDIRYKVDRIFNMNKDVLVPACNNGDVVYEEMSKKLLDISDDAKLIRQVLNAQSGVMIENRERDDKQRLLLKMVSLLICRIGDKILTDEKPPEDLNADTVGDNDHGTFVVDLNKKSAGTVIDNDKMNDDSEMYTESEMDIEKNFKDQVDF